MHSKTRKRTKITLNTKELKNQAYLVLVDYLCTLAKKVERCASLYVPEQLSSTIFN